MHLTARYNLRRMGLFILLGLAACNDNGLQPRAVPAHISIAQGDLQTGTVGSQLDTALTVMVTDRADQPVAGVLVNFGLPAGAGTLSTQATTTDASGQARSRWSLPTTAGTYAAHVKAAGLDSLTFTATATASAPTALHIVSGDTLAGSVGVPLDSAVRLEVRDAFGNPVSGASIVLSVTGGSLSGPTVVTDAAGQGLVSWTMPTDFAVVNLLAVAGPDTARAVAFAFPLDSALLTGGYAHGCRILPGGAAECWGGNSFGELGTGDTAEALTPQPVSGGLAWSSIGGGSLSTCGLTVQEVPYCWGEVLPGGIPSPTLSPVPLGGGVSLRSLTVGAGHACGLDRGGQAYCWHGNAHGEVGVAPQTSWIPDPTPVATTLRFRQISAGNGVTCGLTRTGRAYCWGSNAWGMLGNGGTADESAPSPVATTNRFARISVGDGIVCAATFAGDAWCWGDGTLGGLGNGQFGTGAVRAPVAVVGGHRFANITVGSVFACGLTGGGVAYCWGWNGDGALGAGDLTDRADPTPVSGGLNFTTLHAGFDFVCGRTAGGGSACWGGNLNGRTGTGRTDVLVLPTPAVALPAFVSITSGDEHSCGLTSGGTAYCWGGNGLSQLGDGTTGAPRYAAAAVTGGIQFTSLDAGGHGTCGLGTDSLAYCWGGNKYGQVGDGTTTDRQVPTAVSGGLKFVLLRHGTGDHVCGITETYRLYCWGQNADGQLGDGTLLTRTVPAPIADTQAFTSVSLGYQHTCALTPAHQAYCWGKGKAVGSGDSTGSPTPVAVAGGLSFSAISAGGFHSCGLDLSGAAFCWGSGGGGQLGGGDLGDAMTPTAISGAGLFVALRSGLTATCGLDSSGAVSCWGLNRNGELGVGDQNFRNVPTAMSSSLALNQVSLGTDHVCGLTVAGGTVCWGQNALGQLGQGFGSSLLQPTLVP